MLEEDKDLIGLTEEQALDRLRRDNTPARVVNRDGVFFAVTMDYLPNRVNLTITDGKVKEIDHG